MTTANGWRGKLACIEPGCMFVVYVEGEPTEAALEVIVQTAMTTHFDTNHPDAVAKIHTLPPGLTGAVLPPDGAYEEADQKPHPIPEERPRFQN